MTKSDFTYDGRGRMKIRKEYTWIGYWYQTSETRYVYDGMRVIQERDGSNNPIATYTRSSALSGSLEGVGLPRQSGATAGWIGGMLAKTDSTGTYFYHADGGGSITAMMNTSQGVAATYQYDPYGNVIGWSGGGGIAVNNKYRFSSKEVHTATGFYYCGYRFYDPYSQRWLNRDPIEESGGINLYGFNLNNSANRIDPLGLDAGGRVGPGFPNDGYPHYEIPHPPDWVWNDGEWVEPGIEDRTIPDLEALLGGKGLSSAVDVCKLRGPENEEWKDNKREWQEGWHFHAGKGRGLEKHHLPYEFGNWFRNLIGVIRRKLK